MPPSERLRETIRTHALASPQDPDAVAMANVVVDRGGDSVLGVIFFGSRKTQASPDAWSGYDFFVVTRDYADFYRSLKSAGSMRRDNRIAAALNSILPPNQISIRSGSGEAAPLAKCAVVSLAGLLRETSDHRRDHFFVGRLFQPTAVLYACDGDSGDRIVDALVSAHALTLSWVRPWLPPVFDVETYCRTLLQVSLGREIRPEPTGRSEALWRAQSPYLTATYALLLEDLVGAGELRPAGAGRYELTRPVSRGERLGLAVYFRKSTVRATVRWFKYAATFDDWLDYIVRKAQRHSTQTIVLTPRERRWPLIFLWPRLVRYLRDKDRRTASGDVGSPDGRTNPK